MMRFLWGVAEAADWYGDLMDRTKLRDRWLEGINEDAEDSPGVVRAAAALFVMLGRVYIWPIKTFDEDLEIAIAALSKVANTEEYKESSELAALLQTEIEELKTRRKQKDPSAALNQQAPAKPWWRFWA